MLQLAIATEARYIAMIGSKRKVLNVIRELEKQGIAREAFERIHAPMGLDIGAISPEEIAISVAAEMIAIRRNPESICDLNHSFGALESYLCRWMTGQALDFSSPLAR